jgi:sulfur-oxidizing protein SoxA
MVTETAAPDHMEYVEHDLFRLAVPSDETQVVQMDDFDNPG